MEPFQRKIGSVSVSGQLPTYPSPNSISTLTCCQWTVVELGEGQVRIAQILILIRKIILIITFLQFHFWVKSDLSKGTGLSSVSTYNTYITYSYKKTISNPGLIHRFTNNFHENRKQFRIKESFQNPENFLNYRKIFCHVTLAPAVNRLSRYSTWFRTRLHFIDLESLIKRT